MITWLRRDKRKQMLTFRARTRFPRIIHEDVTIYQQIKKNHYDKYFTELACSVRIGEYFL